MRVPYASLDRGTLLVATPHIDSGLFFRGVVLICEHSEQGTFGLVVNKRVEIELPDDLLNLKEMTNPNIHIRAGGPVQTNQMLLVHTQFAEDQQLLQLCDGLFLGGNLQFLQACLLSEAGPDMMLCFGYAGWGAGQLEQEYLAGNWLPYPANRKLLFHTPPGQLWSSLLRKMGGKYSRLSLIPEDLSLN